MLNHIKTLRAGESGFLAKRARNTIDVYYDQKRYVYEKPQNFSHANRKDFKIEIMVIFQAMSLKGSRLIFEVIQ